MGRSLALALTISVLLTASAMADNTCALLNSIVKHRSSGFSTIDSMDDNNNATITLPHASECYIHDETYWCLWVLDVQFDAAEELRKLGEDIHKCYPQLEYSPRYKGKEPHFFIEGRGVEFYGSVEPDNNEVDLSIANDDE